MEKFIFDIIIILVCLGGLWIGAVWVVETASIIARKLGISELVIGLTIVAIGTSAPEFAVSAVAAIKGLGNISVGNVIGSNIFNLGFILGGVALVRPINATRSLVLRDGSVLIGTTFLLMFLMRDLHVALWEGLLLMGLLVVYVGYLIYQREAPEESAPMGEFRWHQVPQLIAGFVIIIVSSHFLVDSASNVARFFGISEWVIGVTIVAAGTSTPEIVTSLVAVLKGHHSISLGNLIGSDLFNLLGVLGLAATLQSMDVSSSAYSSLYALSGMMVAVVVMMRTGWKVSRLEGGILLTIAIVRWIMDFSR